MEAAVQFAVRVRLVAGIDDRSTLHRVHALEFREEIAPLRNLKPRTNELVLFFPAKLAGTADDLAGHEKRHHRRAQHVPREFPRHQVILVAAVAVTAEVRVVLVEQDRVIRPLIKVPGAGHEQGIASVILLQQLQQPAALRRTILRMGVVVVEPGAVAQHQVALDFAKGERALRVLGEVVRFVGVLKQLLHSKAPRITMRIFTAIIPAHADTRRGGAADEGDGFRDDIHAFRILAGYPDLGFGAELDVHRCNSSVRVWLGSLPSNAE